MQTRVVPFDDASIEEATRLILEGQPVAVPTETVYGQAGREMEERPRAPLSTVWKPWMPPSL